MSNNLQASDSIIYRKPLTDVIYKENEFKELMKLYSSWLDDTKQYRSTRLYRVLSKYGSIVEEHLDIIVYVDLRMEVIPRDLQMVSSKVLKASRRDVTDYLLNVIKLTPQHFYMDYDRYRYFFTELYVHPISVKIVRKGQEVKLYYKHEKYYDMLKHPTEFMNAYCKSDKDTQIKMLKNESGLINYLATLYEDDYLDNIKITTECEKGYTVISINVDTLSFDFQETEVVVNIETFEDMEDIIGCIPVPKLVNYGEEDGESIDVLTVLLNEFILNFVMHDGAPEDVNIEVYTYDCNLYGKSGQLQFVAFKFVDKEESNVKYF